MTDHGKRSMRTNGDDRPESNLIDAKGVIDMKVAIVHDWFVSYAGSERVVEQILHCLPHADVFTLINALDASDQAFLGGRTVQTSFLQKMPGALGHHSRYLPLMPLAIEQLDLSGYDLIVSSSHAVAKGVLTGPDQLHICYCHTPIRYAWDLQHQYLHESGLSHGIKGWIARWLLHKLRIWDTRTANGVDHFIANSAFIARRIHKAYRREAEVIYPPVDVNSFVPVSDKEDFYLTASRLVPYKKVPLIIEAFNQMPDKKLVVIGSGPDDDRCRSMAGANIELLGYQSTDVLRRYMQRAKAFVFAAEEDFGITPVEAQACGTPVIALGKGGARETIRGLDRESPTGVLFRDQTSTAICDAVRSFEANRHRIAPESCRENAERFSIDRFRATFSEFVSQRVRDFQSSNADS